MIYLKRELLVIAFYFLVSFRSGITKICEFDLSIVKDLTHGPDGNKDECQWCGFTCDNLTSLYIHVHECRKQMKIYKCALCGKQLKNKKTLKMHMLMNHLDEHSTSCNFCKLKFESVDELKSHFEECKIKWKNRVKTMQCKYCGKVKNSQKAYLVHLRRCKPPQGFECDHCKKTFQYKKAIETHMEIKHLKDRPFACDLCGRTFKTKTYLDYHIKWVHMKLGVKKRKIFSCSVCSKSFKSRLALRDHQHVHTGVKSYKCNYCEKTFTYKGGVTRHFKNVHQTKEKKPPVQCELCGKSYADTTGLGNHMKIKHLGIKPKCHICNKTFAGKKGLDIHMNTHTGVKPWYCEICGRSFSTKNYLDVHIRIHTGETPYKCRMCPKSFKQKTSLTAHYRVNHPGFQVDTAPC